MATDYEAKGNVYGFATYAAGKFIWLIFVIS